MVQKRTHISAFSLLELAVVIAIISVVAGVGMNLGSDALTFSNRIATQQQMKIIKTAIEHYHMRNGVFPCPARNGDIPGVTNNFGESSCTPSGSDIIRINSGANAVLQGMVPIRALDLPDFFASDAWGQKISYAVTENLTTVSNYTFNTARINIRAGDPSGTNFQLTRDANGAAYVVYSAGENSKGAYGYRTNSIAVPCTAGTIDAQNCDNDANRIFYDTFFNDGTTAMYFDDFVVWGTK